MAQTILSSSTPYCLAAELFVYHDSDQVADMLRQGDDARPSYVSMVTITTEPGAKLYRLLKAAAGRIETVALIGKRYAPADLAALYASDTTGKEMLVKLNADLAFWAICQRRQPNASDPKNVPGALEAMEMLKALRDGEAVFAFQETAEAGLVDVVQAQPAQLYTPNVVRRAARLFPLCQINDLSGGGDG